MLLNENHPLDGQGRNILYYIYHRMSAQQHPNRKKKYVSPLQSLDFYLPHFQALCKRLKLQHELAELTDVLQRNVAPEIVRILEDTDYEALVVTDTQKNSVWVNHGFREMTGYAKTFALGKRPIFLQGVNTSKTTKKEIRELLQQEIRFSKTLVNYRKNGEEYHCHIDVVPLRNAQNQVTHFLAMESEQHAA